MQFTQFGYRSALCVSTFVLALASNAAFAFNVERFDRNNGFNAFSREVEPLARPVHIRTTAYYNGAHLVYATRYGVYTATVMKPAPFATEEFEEDKDDVELDEFDAADRDNDGYLSFREARTANPTWARDFRRIDTDNDGFLTREELDAFYRK